MNKFHKIFEWLATAVLIIGVALTAWNIYPSNIYFSLLGNLMWLYLGFTWKKWSLVSVQLLITILYIGGLINIIGL